VGARAYPPSGSEELDRASIEAARKSTYEPEIFRCDPVAGTYLFKLTFTVGSR